MIASSFIAFKYIKSKKYKFLPSLSFLTSFFGIFLSVFALIATLSVMEGFSQEFQKNIIGIRHHIKVYFMDNTTGRPIIFTDYTNKEAQILNASNQIIYASPAVAGEAMINSTKSLGGKVSAVFVSGIEKEAFYKREILAKGLKQGSFTEDGIVIGSELAFILGAQVGDSINLISPSFRKTPFGDIPIHKTLKVSGIFNVGMNFYDSSFVFLPLTQAQNFFMQNGATFLEVIVKNPENVSQVTDEIYKKLGSRVFITDWKAENKSFISAIKLQKSVMFFILLMFLLLASFITFSSLSSLVMQKAKTTAILQTMGFSKAQVVLMFFQVGFFTALPALILGLLAGSLFVLTLEDFKNWLEVALQTKVFDGAYYFLSYIPSKIEPEVLVQVSIISLLLCFVAILLPSIRALKTKPIESLKWE